MSKEGLGTLWMQSITRSKKPGIDTGRKRIVDLAAGTGKLTRSALQHCHFPICPSAVHDPQISHAKRRLQ